MCELVKPDPARCDLTFGVGALPVSEEWQLQVAPDPYDDPADRALPRVAAEEVARPGHVLAVLRVLLEELWLGDSEMREGLGHGQRDVAASLKQVLRHDDLERVRRPAR